MKIGPIRCAPCAAGGQQPASAGCCAGRRCPLMRRLSETAGLSFALKLATVPLDAEPGPAAQAHLLWPDCQGEILAGQPGQMRMGTTRQQPCARHLQGTAWSPGIYEEQQRAAGLTPYNGGAAQRDRNVHLRWAGAGPGRPLPLRQCMRLAKAWPYLASLHYAVFAPCCDLAPQVGMAGAGARAHCSTGWQYDRVAPARDEGHPLACWVATAAASEKKDSKEEGGTL